MSWPAAFAVTKRQLAAPEGETRLDYDREVEALWKDPKIHATIRTYVERTIGKSSR